MNHRRMLEWSVSVVCIFVLCLVGGCGGGPPSNAGQVEDPNQTSLSPVDMPEGASEFVTWPTEAELARDLLAAGKSLEDLPVLFSGAEAPAGTGEEVRPTAYMYEPPFGWLRSQYVRVGRTSWFEKNLYYGNSIYKSIVAPAAGNDADLYVYAPIRGLNVGLKLVGYSVKGTGVADVVWFRPDNFGGPGWFVFAVYGYSKPAQYTSVKFDFYVGY